MKIHKFNIPDIPTTMVIEARSNNLLSIGLDGSNFPCVYIAERDVGEVNEIEIEVVWTGGEMPVDKVFLGTVHTKDFLVLHVFYKLIKPKVVTLDSHSYTDPTHEWLATGHG